MHAHKRMMPEWPSVLGKSHSCLLRLPLAPCSLAPPCGEPSSCFLGPLRFLTSVLLFCPANHAHVDSIQLLLNYCVGQIVPRDHSSLSGWSQRTTPLGCAVMGRDMSVTRKGWRQTGKRKPFWCRDKMLVWMCRAIPIPYFYKMRDDLTVSRVIFFVIDYWLCIWVCHLTMLTWQSCHGWVAGSISVKKIILLA